MEAKTSGFSSDNATKLLVERDLMTTCFKSRSKVPLNYFGQSCNRIRLTMCLPLTTPQIRTNLHGRNQVANCVYNLEISKQRTRYFSCIKRSKRAKKLQMQLFADLKARTKVRMKRFKANMTGIFELEEFLMNKHIVTCVLKVLKLM